MTVTEFMVIWLSCLLTMLACRCIPIFILKGKNLPERLENALNLIPPAAFAALVANDLFNPTTFEEDFAQGIVSILAAVVVVIVARKTNSLIWCVIAGVASFALLGLGVAAIPSVALP